MSWNQLILWCMMYQLSWLDKNRKAKINPINKNDNKCIQYVPILALNHKAIKKYLERVSRFEPFIDKYTWKDTNYPAIVLNVLYAKKEKCILPTFQSKTQKHEKQTTFLIISSKTWWHYVALNKLSALLTGITSKHDCGFYCLKYFYLLWQRKQTWIA